MVPRSPSLPAQVAAWWSAEGYPGKPRTGDSIEGLDQAEALGSKDMPLACFHAGTKVGSPAPLTAGGRVLGITAAAPDLRQAAARAVEAASMVRFQGSFFRRDIGHRVLSSR